MGSLGSSIFSFTLPPEPRPPHLVLAFGSQLPALKSSHFHLLLLRNSLVLTTFAGVLS